MRIAPAAWLLACLFAAAAVRAESSAPPPPDGLRQQISAAVAARQPRVVIPPGVYRLGKPAGSAVILTIRDAKNLEIVADGVTLLCTDRTRAIEITRCTGLTLRGLTVDYDPPTFTQGKVVAEAEDGGSIDIRIDAGYPRQPFSRIDVVDPATRFRKKGMPFLWGAKAAMAGPDVVRISLKGIGRAAAVGDLASLSAGAQDGVPHGIVIDDSPDTTLDRVTVHAAPGMGILDAGGEGGTRLIGCRVVPGPRPAGAAEERLLSTSWDAIHHKTSRRGPVVEDCVIERAGDDSWSVTSGDYLVLKADGDRLVLASRDDSPGARLRPGDRLRTANDSPDIAVRESAPVRLDDAGLDPAVLDKVRTAAAWTPWQVSRQAMRVTTDGPSGLAVGQAVFCPSAQSNGFVFRRNRVHSSGRGALVKASDGLIEGNTFDTAHAAVTVCPELPDGAAVGLRNIVIRGNTIRETGFFCPAPWSSQAGAISVTATSGPRTLRPAGAFEHIVIQGNTFRGVCGPNIVVASARDLALKGNTFADVLQTTPPPTGAAYGIDPACVLWLDLCDGVRLEENTIGPLGPCGKQALHLGPGCRSGTN